MCTVLLPPGINRNADSKVYHIIPYHIISYHTISYRTISYHIIYPRGSESSCWNKATWKSLPLRSCQGTALSNVNTTIPFCLLLVQLHITNPLYCGWFQSSVAVKMRSYLFWNITQRWLVFSYRRFGTTSRCKLQAQEYETDCISRNVGNQPTIDAV